MDIRSEIIDVFHSVVDWSGTTLAVPLSDDTVLLETGLDSLGFAVLVLCLEERLGYDPFSLSDSPYYPQTFGDFVSFYQKSCMHHAEAATP